jgi:hypothetical protein
MERAFRITLTAHFPDGRPVKPADFIDLLHVDPKDRERELVRDVFAGGSRWQAARVVFLDTDATRYDTGELLDYSTIYLPVQERAAEWLRGREDALFDRFREHGLTVRMVIGLAIDQNEMEFRLAPDFLLACAEKGWRSTWSRTRRRTARPPAFRRRESGPIPG